MRQLLVLATAIALFACAATAAAGPRADAAKTPKCGGKKATVKGTKKADRLKGTRKADVIAGLGGNDKIKSLGGNDIVCDGGGNDTVSLGAGNDKAIGGAGKDKITGGAGKDGLKGGRGDDTLTGGGGNDAMDGGPGTDTCNGGAGKNTYKSCEKGDNPGGGQPAEKAPPVVTTSAGSVAWVEGAGPVRFDNGLTVSDLDSLALQGATVRISANHVPGQDALAFTNQLGITGTYDAGTGVLTLTGTASIADYQTALRSVAYENSSNAPSTAVRTLSVQVTDASALPSNTGTRDLTLAATNDAPSLTASPGPLEYGEGDPGQVVDPALSVADPDDTNLEGATVRISSGFVQLDNDLLDFTDQNGISHTYDAGTGVLTLTGTATVAHYQAALRSVTFETDATDGDARTIEFTVTDGDASSAPVTKDVTVGPANTAPVVDTTDTNLAYTENDPPTVVDPGVTVTDPDSGQAGATVLISGNYDSSQDVLGFTNQNGINGSWDSAAGELTLTGTASTADYQTALRSVTYQNTSDVPTSLTRTVLFQTTDTHGADSAQADRTIDITPVDDPPVPVDDSATVAEDAPATAVPVLANDTDADGGSPTIASATDPDHGTVVLTGGSPGAHTGLTYQPDPDYCNDPPGTTPDTFSYTVTGGGSADVQVTVTCVNDAPVADDETFDGANSAVGNTTLVVDDPDDGAPTAVRPKKSITGDILSGDSDVDGPGPLTITPGTFATNDGGVVTIEADGDFVFEPAAATSCTDTSDFFDYTVKDGGSPEQSDTGRVTIAIAGCVWYVNNNDPGNSGTSAAPFDTLAQAETASSANNTIFVFDGDNTSTGYAAGINLKSGQRLLGEAATLTVGADTLYPADASKKPTITDSGADVIDLDDGNEVRGLDLEPEGTGGGIAGTAGDTGGGTIADVTIVDAGPFGTQPGIELDGTTGTFNFQDLTVSTNGATAVRLNNAGTARFASTGTISLTASGAKGLDATGTSMGPGSVFDDITVTGSGSGGVSMVNTTGTTTLGDGTGTDLDLTTTSGATGAFVLSNAGSVTVPGAGTAQVAADGGPAIDVSGTSGASLDFDTVSSTNSAGRGIDLDGLGSGTFSAGAGSITGTAGIAFRVNGGSGNVTYPGNLNNGGGDAASIMGRTGGTVALSGNIADSNDVGGGISLSGNTGGSTTFSGASKAINTATANAVVMSSSDGHTLNFTNGGLDIDTTSGKGLEAVNSGTLTVTGTGNTIDTTTGTPLNVAATDVGATPLTLQRISSNGAANGLKLDATGSNAALTVTGAGGTCTAADTSGCSGGTILSTQGSDDASTLPVGAGIALRNTRGVSLTRMRLTSAQNYGIRGSGVAGLTIANSLINGTNGTTALTANKDSSAKFDELTGTVSITDTELSGGFTSNLLVNNTTGTLDATLTNFKSGTLDSTGGDDAVQFEGLTNATTNVTVQNSTFTTATGDVFQYTGNGSGGGALSFTGNAVSNNEPTIANGGGGVTVSGGARGTTTLNIQSNTFRDSLTAALTVVKSREAGFSGSFGGTINLNTIGVNGLANSGSLGGSGIAVTNFGSGNQTLNVTNNTVQQYNSSGMTFTAGAGVAETGQLNLNISGNTVRQPGTNPSVTLFQGVRVDSGVTAGDNFATCVNFGANSITGSSDAANKDFRLVANNSGIRLPGYGGSTTDDAAVVAFVAGKIGGSPGGTAARGTGTWSGTGTTCP